MSPFIHTKRDYFKTKFIASLFKGRFGGNVNIVAEISAQKKEQFCELLFFSVRIKGLEPPRLSASDPKSDVATNYTISAS